MTVCVRADHMIQNREPSAPFVACGSLAAPVKEDSTVEFRGTKPPAGFCSRSGGGEKYQAREQGRRGDSEKREKKGSEGVKVLFPPVLIHQSASSHFLSMIVVVIYYIISLLIFFNFSFYYN